jgi:hypothetical protein
MNNFDTIYKLALAKDEAGLKRLSPKCLDESKAGDPYMSAAAQLAMEGKFEAVDLLIRLGARINYIAYGAAKGGYGDYTEGLRLRGAQVNYIARGAAMGGHREHAEELRTTYRANVDIIAFAAAAGGYHDYAEELQIMHGATAQTIACGAAYGGYRDYAEKIRINDTTARVSMATSIAISAAEGGHRGYAESLRINLQANADLIAQAAAKGGHREYAEWLRINCKVSNDLITCGAAGGGHRGYAEEIRGKYGAVNAIIDEAASGGYGDYVVELLHLQPVAEIDTKRIAYIVGKSGHSDYAEALRIAGVSLGNTTYKVNVLQIAYGAAAAGHRDFAEKLRLSLGSLGSHASVNEMAKQAAAGGHRDYAEELRTKHGADPTVIIDAAAAGGDRPYASELRALMNRGGIINPARTPLPPRIPNKPLLTIPKNPTSSSENNNVTPEVATLRRELVQSREENVQLRKKLADAMKVISDVQKAVSLPTTVQQRVPFNPQGQTSVSNTVSLAQGVTVSNADPMLVDPLPLDKDFEQARNKIAESQNNQAEASNPTNATHKRKRSDEEEVDTGRESKRKKEEANNATESAPLTDRNTFFAPAQDDVMIVASTGASDLVGLANVAIKTEQKH